MRREHGVSTWVRNSLTVTDLAQVAPPIILEDLFGVVTPKKNKKTKERSFGSFDNFLLNN